MVNRDFEQKGEITATLIKVDNAYQSLATLMMMYEASKPKKQGISSLASIAQSAKIGENCYIAPFVVIGEGCEIGDNCCIHDGVSIGDGAKIGNNCLLYAHVTVYHDCRIGNNCILHSGCVIGADGFGFAPTPRVTTRYHRLVSLSLRTMWRLERTLALTVQQWEQQPYTAA